ncbi:uncharacterized protein [Antedon mediterranea]|uniref:uncharacterized protein isoform X2 n=1 Tax=Antedon mediterranea TaxID=105859 RepID=UPI003AF4C1A8
MVGSGYGKPVSEPEGVAEGTDTTDAKLNNCAADVIRLIAQQEKSHQMDLSGVSEECLEMVNGAMKYVKELGDSSPSVVQSKRNKDEGSGDGALAEGESSVSGWLPDSGEWKNTVDNVLYHLLKALEFEHQKLQKTLKWVAELQNNQNQLAKGKDLIPGEMLEQNDVTKQNNRGQEKTPADRMKDFYNELKPGEFRGLKNKPSSFTWNNKQELINGDSASDEEYDEESASEIPAEDTDDANLEDSASETPAEDRPTDDANIEDSASETPAEDTDDANIEDSASETPAEQNKLQGEETDGEDSASETPAEDSASETPAEDTEEVDDSENTEDGIDRDDSASETPAEENGEDSASEIPAEENGEDSASETPAEQNEGDSASEIPAEESGEDSASETPAEENVEDSASETSAEENGEDSASEIPAEKNREESASETPAEENEEDSASEIPGEENGEDSASETPAEENGNDSASEIPAEEKHMAMNTHNFGSKGRSNRISNNFQTNQKIKENNNFEKTGDNLIREGNENNEFYDDVKRQPEVVLKDEQVDDNQDSSSFSSDNEEENEQDLSGSNENIKDTVVNELKGLRSGNNQESKKMIVDALKKLSMKKTQT